VKTDAFVVEETFAKAMVLRGGEGGGLEETKEESGLGERGGEQNTNQIGRRGSEGEVR